MRYKWRKGTRWNEPWENKERLIKGKNKSKSFFSASILLVFKQKIKKRKRRSNQGREQPLPCAANQDKQKAWIGQLSKIQPK